MSGPNAASHETLPEAAKVLSEWLDKFRKAQPVDAQPLLRGERSGFEMLAGDLRALKAGSATSVGRGSSYFQRVFSRFETLRGGHGSFLHRCGQVLAGGDTGSRRPNGKTPVQAPAAPDGPTHDHEVFDRLSQHYGGQYRGAIVFSYRLVIVAVVLALLSRLAGELRLDHLFGKSVGLVLGVTEIAVVALIYALYLVGSTSEVRALRRGWRRSIRRGWRRRWLEYRLLAERFRYAELLRITGLPLDQAWRNLLAEHPGAHWLERHARKPGEYWHERLFLARVGEAPRQDAPADFADRFQHLLAQQNAYHQRVTERRGHISHRLHKLATRCLIVAGILTLMHVPLLYEPFEHWLQAKILAACVGNCGQEPVHFLKGLIIFFAGVLTGFSAAVHGTLSTTEYAKLAEISREMVRELDALATLTKHKLEEGAPATALAPEVESFCRLVTEDATGWTLLLHDKDLPQGGHG